jgi:hypothetical protein
MSNAKVTLADIANKVLDTYNIDEKWVLKKMRSKYVNRIVAILQITW